MLRTLEQSMRAPTCFRWVHFRNVGGGFLLPKIAIANPAKIPKRHQAEPHYHSNIW